MEASFLRATCVQFVHLLLLPPFKMMPSNNSIRKRKRDQLGRLLFCCFGRRKWNPDDKGLSYYESDYGADRFLRHPVSPSKKNGFYSRSRSLESLPPILLVPSDDVDWSGNSLLPKTEEGAVILHQGYSKRSLPSDVERAGGTLDERQLSEAVRRAKLTNQNHRSEDDESEDDDLRGWDSLSAHPVEITFTKSAHHHTEETSDADDDELAIELPTMRRLKDSPNIPESNSRGSTIVAMKRRASITGTV